METQQVELLTDFPEHLAETLAMDFAKRQFPHLQIDTISYMSGFYLKGSDPRNPESPPICAALHLVVEPLLSELGIDDSARMAIWCKKPDEIKIFTADSEYLCIRQLREHIGYGIISGCQPQPHIMTMYIDNEFIGLGLQLD